VTNQGDYDLGFMAARHGEAFKKRPGFVGNKVAENLVSGNMDANW
jgi:hypothetical protein